jgi:hypothetical protein
MESKRGGAGDQKNRCAAPLIGLWNQVDVINTANAVPKRQRGGKVRKILFLLFLALVRSSKIPTDNAGARRRAAPAGLE